MSRHIAAIHHAIKGSKSDAAAKVEPEVEVEADKADEYARLPNTLWIICQDVQHRLGLTEMQVRQCYSVFTSAKMDAEGSISVFALEDLMRRLGQDVDPMTLQELVSRYDIDRNGRITFTEFIMLFSRLPSLKQGCMQLRLETCEKLLKDSWEPDPGKDIPLEERIEAFGVPCAHVKRKLRREISEASACLQLPAACLLFVTFVVSIMLHERIEKLHMQDRTFEFDLIENANFAFSGIIPMENGRMGHKSVYDINTIADFWSWLGMGLVPLVWVESWDVSEPRTNVLVDCKTAPVNLQEFDDSWMHASAGNGTGNNSLFQFKVCPEDPDKLPPLPKKYLGEAPEGMYLYYNRVIGGLRLRQERTEGNVDLCTRKDIADKAFQAPCFPTQYWLRPESRSGLRTDNDMVNEESDAPGGTQYLRTLMTQTAVRAKLTELENKIWVSPATQKIELSFATYNGNTDCFTLCFVNLFFTRAGHIHKQIEPVSLWMDPYPNWTCYAADFMWIFLVGRIFIWEVIEIVSNMRRSGWKKGLMDYADPWNIVDWISIAFGVLLVGLWIDYLVALSRLRGWLEQVNLATPGGLESDEDLATFFHDAHDTILRKQWVRFFVAMYPFVIASRFFKAFSAQPRLAVVTNTLARSFVDIYHFGIVFGTIFLIFTFSAIVLFGQELLPYVNFVRAIPTCWRVLLGDFDWEGMADVGRAEATVWFSVFSFLVLQVMLNMLIAIIMDVYSEVKGAIGGDAETLVTQAREIWERWRGQRRGEQLPLETVMKRLAPPLLRVNEDGTEENDNEVLKPQDLCDQVPDLPLPQAADILKAAQEVVDMAEGGSHSINDAMGQILEIGHRQQRIALSLNTLLVQNELRLEHVAAAQEKEALAAQAQVRAEPGSPTRNLVMPRSVRNLVESRAGQDSNVVSAVDALAEQVSHLHDVFTAQQAQAEQRAKQTELRHQQRLDALEAKLDRRLNELEMVTKGLRSRPSVRREAPPQPGGGGNPQDGKKMPSAP